MIYPLAPDGVWATWQGEGHLAGLPQTFIRLAGCSIGCAHCDTDYSVAARVELAELIHLVEVTAPRSRERWAWITGGEPTDHDLRPLVLGLKRKGFLVALATAGERPVADPVDWLSVSPHRPGRLRQRFGHECKVVLPALDDTEDDPLALVVDCEDADFWFRYVQPRADTDFRHCVAFARERPAWGLSGQWQRVWGVR